jgi:hypothetical protein
VPDGGDEGIIARFELPSAGRRRASASGRGQAWRQYGSVGARSGGDCAGGTC